MLSTIRRYFADHLAEPGADQSESPEALDHRLRLATAALLIEVTRTERSENPAEAAALARAVQEKFGLERAETEALLGLAHEEVEQSTSYYDFTALIHEHYDLERKSRVMELMWRVAAADGTVDGHQEAMLRKIADLLYLPHKVFIQAKLRALDDAGAAAR